MKASSFDTRRKAKVACAVLAVGIKGSLIQWPNERQIQEVSARLAQMRRMGIRLEAAGDYFSSGDLAYQIQEILRATEDLFKKSQRIKR